MTQVLVLFSLLYSLSSLAWDCDPSNSDSYASCISEVEQVLSGPQIECDQNTSHVPTKCEEKQKKFFADGTVNVTIAGGYFDSNGTLDDGVYDEYWINKQIELLTSPCPATYELLSTSQYGGTAEEVAATEKDRKTGCGKKQSYDTACGFRRTDDPEYLVKSVKVDGRAITVKIRVLNASLTSSDKYNRASQESLVRAKFCQNQKAALAECIKKNSPPKISKEKLKSTCKKGDEHFYQLCKSQYVRNAWRESIENGDEIVIYDGHARDGGGPSFDPPVVLPNGHVDYNWYRKNKPGHKDETEAFSKAVKKGKAPSYYASLSCNGIRNFVKKGNFPSVSPKTTYALSKRTSYPDEGLATMLNTLEGSLKKQCPEDINKKIEGASCAYKLYNF